MLIISTINWKRLASVFVLGVPITAISAYVLGFHAPPSPDLRVPPGKTLVTHGNFYPIHADDTGVLYLDRELFVKVVNYLSQHPSSRVVADLICLSSSNNVTLLLDGPTEAKYLMLIQQPGYVALSEVDQEKDRISQFCADVVNDIGQTFASTPVETVLHNIHDPLRSIMAVQNPISGRRLGDTDTNFGIQLAKNYSYGEGQGRGRGASSVSYGLTLRGGRTVKSTTIPISHDVYSLIEFICINIDISKMNRKHPKYIECFVDTSKVIAANGAVNEIIQNSRREN